jgi:hypothetical protein
LAVATLVLVLSLMALALLTMLGLVIWSLIRGRRPTIDLSRFARARGFRPGASSSARAPAGGEVVDVEVREVRDVRNPAPRLEP